MASGPHMTQPRGMSLMPLLMPMLLLLFLLLLVQRSLAASFASSKPPTLELPRPLAMHMHSEEASMQVQVQVHRNGRSRRPTLMDVALQQSVRQGLDAMAEVYGKIQPNMLRNGQMLQDNHPAALLSRFNAPHSDGRETEQREMAAYATIAATKAFRKNFQNIDELARQSHVHKISLRRTALESLCPPREPPACMPASERYRTHDGTCNNKRRPRWGAAQMPFNRFLPPEYGDGVDTVRSSTDGSPLSSSRFVSLLVHGARDGEAALTLMIAQWGQLLDHDLTSTAQPRSINGSIPSCCGGKDFHPSCFPIKVPLDDPWLAPLKVRCLEFLRSAPAQRRDCVLSWREQTNQATSYIDASPIYSNSAKSADNARVFRNGLLIYGRGNPEEDVCQRGAIATQCIRAGDGRSGEQPGLLAMHHVWVGEHNRIALELGDMNPHWSDEKVYQETRRIVGAMFQHITYREFLPIILGREVCKLFDLDLLSTGYYEGYDPKVNPTVGNSFAAAAFRFGHSLVQNSYMRCDRHHNIINNNVSLHEEFQRGDIGSAGSLHRLLRGLASQRALKRDEFITPELTNHLFQTPGFPFGLDLAAINVQRGRDHGIAPYTAWRVPCGLSPIQSFDDLANVVGPESAQRISHAYRSVHDIDLFVGGIAERPVVGGLVGPTFACIIAQQFSNSRRGDRFWYENGAFESSFTPAQLHSLRRVSLSQVLCRAVGGGTLQPHIFIPAEFPENERVTCGEGMLTSIDLSPWLEQDPFLRPEQGFEKVPNGLGGLQVIKEDKAGFANRPIHKPHVDFIPNASVGFQRPTNNSKINDKLDLKRKQQAAATTTTNKRQPTRRPLNGVSNKLDKSPKITISIKGNNNGRRPVASTTRRTVIINNVPIQLRSKDGADGHTKEASVTQTTTDTDTEGTETEVDAGDTEEDGLNTEARSTNDLDSKLNETRTATNTTVSTTMTSTAADPSDQTDVKKVKRMARNSKQSTNSEKTPTPSEIEKLSKLLHLPRNRTVNTSATGRTPSSPATSTTAMSARHTRSTKPPKLSKTTTKRGVELRSQYQSRPIYSRPQKVIVNGPNADQYEIEINIRQTNKSPAQRPVTGHDYQEYTTVYKPYTSYDSSYAPHYLDYAGGSSTTPAYGYYQAAQPPPLSPTILPSSGQTHKTKPPTIIYLTDNDDRHTTTRQPNIFQNLLTFATNGFNGNRRPTSTPSHERPNYDNYVVNTPHGILSTSSSYAPRPPLTQSGSVLSYPVSTSSQAGFSHASSSAVSSGHYGSISGVASANGADSAFNINIRPRPDPNSVVSTYPRPQSLGGTYGLHRPDYASQGDLYYDREIQAHGQSPFSSAGHAQRPHQTLPYYGRNSELTKQPVADHKLDFVRDYDYVSRTLTNVSHSFDDYGSYDDDSGEEPNDVTPSRIYDKDGYLRPELMLASLGKSNSHADKNLTNLTHYLDDNYVLSRIVNRTDTLVTDMPKPLLLSRSSTNSKVTAFPGSLAKQLDNDILAEAEDYDEVQIPNKKRIQLATAVAFAPIKVLTKPDRPDNWVIYAKINEEPPLPRPPSISMDSAPTAEVPMPIRSLHNAWRKQDFHARPETVTATTTTAATALSETTPQPATATTEIAWEKGESITETDLSNETTTLVNTAELSTTIKAK